MRSRTRARPTSSSRRSHGRPRGVREPSRTLIRTPRLTQIRYDTAWVPANSGVTPSGQEEDCVFDPARIRVLRRVHIMEVEHSDRTPCVRAPCHVHASMPHAMCMRPCPMPCACVPPAHVLGAHACACISSPYMHAPHPLTCMHLTHPACMHLSCRSSATPQAPARGSTPLLRASRSDQPPLQRTLQPGAAAPLSLSEGTEALLCTLGRGRCIEWVIPAS